MDHLLVELIIDEVVGARAQGEAFRCHEDPQRTTLDADRAVAGDHVGEVRGHVVAHLSAVAAAGIVLRIRHGWSPAGPRYNAAPNANTRERDDAGSLRSRRQGPLAGAEEGAGEGYHRRGGEALQRFP